MDIQTLTAVAELGSAGGILVLAFMFWNRLKEKDDKHYELSEKVLSAFQNQTKVTEGVRHSIEGNTKAMDGLTQTIYNTLRSHKNDKK